MRPIDSEEFPIYPIQLIIVNLLLKTLTPGVFFFALTVNIAVTQTNVNWTFKYKIPQTLIEHWNTKSHINVVYMIAVIIVDDAVESQYWITRYCIQHLND